MYRIRCTKTLLDRVPLPYDPMEDDSLPTTTLLGNWYATKIVGRPYVVLFVNERTLLPVLVPYAPLKDLPWRFSDHLCQLLPRLGVAQEVTDAESAAMDEVAVTKTASRRILGSMNDQVRNAKWNMQKMRDRSLVEMSEELAKMPLSVIHYMSPGKLAAEVLSAKRA